MPYSAAIVAGLFVVLIQSSPAVPCLGYGYACRPPRKASPPAAHSAVPSLWDDWPLTPKKVRSMVRRGAPVDERNSLNHTPLLFFAEGFAPPMGMVRRDDLPFLVPPGTLKVMAALLDCGANPNAQDMFTGLSPLHYAVFGGNSKAVALLLKHRANVDIRARYGLTPLMMTDDIEIARLLIEHGADVNAYTRNPKTGEEWPVLLYHEHDAEIYLLLVENGAYRKVSSSQSHPAVPSLWDGWGPIGPKAARARVRHGAPVDERNVLDETPLLASARLLVPRGKLQREELVVAHPPTLDLMSALLDCGANVNVRDPFGMSPLHYAVGSGCIKAVALLLRHGAAVDARDLGERTPLMFATNVEIARLLIAHGADVNAHGGDAHGREGSVLWWHDDDPSITQLLLEHGAHR